MLNKKFVQEDLHWKYYAPVDPDSLYDHVTSIMSEPRLDRVRMGGKIELTAIPEPSPTIEEIDFPIVDSLEELYKLADARISSYNLHPKLKNPTTALDVEALELLEKYMDKLCLKT